MIGWNCEFLSAGLFCTHLAHLCKEFEYRWILIWKWLQWLSTFIINWLKLTMNLTVMQSENLKSVTIILTSNFHRKVRATIGLAPKSQLPWWCYIKLERTTWERNGLVETPTLQGIFAKSMREKAWKSSQHSDWKTPQINSKNSSHWQTLLKWNRQRQLIVCPFHSGAECWP